MDEHTIENTTWNRERTTGSKFRCPYKIIDERNICYCRSNSRTDGHPEGLSIGEAVVKAVFHAKYSHSSDVNDI
jgi:hypothetical protein